MAKGSIATAWIQVLPSLEGLHSALVKASKGAVLTPAVKPKLASGTGRLFASNGLGMSKLFSGSFNKSLNLQGGVKNALSSVFASFSSSGRRSANAFGNGFANLDLNKYLNAAAPSPPWHLSAKPSKPSRPTSSKWATSGVEPPPC